MKPEKGSPVVLRRLVVLAVAVLAVGAAPAQAVKRDDGGKPNFDSRAGQRADVPRATRDAREAYEQRLGIEAAVTADPVNGGLRSAGRTDALLTGPQSGDAARLGLDYVRDHLAVFGLDGGDLDGLREAARYT